MFYWETGVPLAPFVGLAGVAIYISGYFGLQAGLIKGQGYLYAGLITTAACLMLISLAENFNLPSVIIQITYISISVFGMVQFYLLTHHIRFSDEERSLLDIVLPDVPKLESRRFLDLGTWKNESPATVPTKEGEPVHQLHYLFNGTTDITVSGKSVARLDPHSLIGEMAVVMGVPASATVTLIEPSRVFGVEAAVLDGFLARNLNVRHALESRIANHLGEKLVRANTALSAIA